MTSRDGRGRSVYIHHSSLFLCFKVEFIKVFERIYYWKVFRGRLEEIANQENLTMEEKVKKKGGKSHGKRCIAAGCSNVKSAEVAMFLFTKDEDEPGWCHCFVD